MLRHALFLVAALLVACGGAGDPALDAPPADTDVRSRPDASTEGVRCPDVFSADPPMVCDEEAPVCCLEGRLMRPACKDSLAACGTESKLACDDAFDCGAGQSCCLLESFDGRQTKFRATCKDRCSLFERPMCAGPGTCAEGQTCCFEPGDILGICVPDGQPCPEPGEEEEVF